MATLRGIALTHEIGTTIKPSSFPSTTSPGIGVMRPSGSSRVDSWLGGDVVLVKAPRYDDVRGALAAFEFDDLPFQPRRVFTVRDVPAGTVRGQHAVVNQTQLLIAANGRIDVEVRNSTDRAVITLDSPHQGLLIEPGIWSALTFIGDGTVLVSLASGAFEQARYTNEPAGQ